MLDDVCNISQRNKVNAKTMPLMSHEKLAKQIQRKDFILQLIQSLTIFQ